MEVQGFPFLRSDFARTTVGRWPNGDHSDVSRHSDEVPVLYRAVGRRYG